MIQKCRSCSSQPLLPILDLGNMPLTAAFIPIDRPDEPEDRFPLQLTYCPRCSLAQVNHEVPPSLIFGRDYPYFSSFSPKFMTHSRTLADSLRAERNLSKDSLVVEVASNDGYFLRNFVEWGVPVLGIDPASGPVRRAREIGVPSMEDYFGIDLAKQLVKEGKRADVIVGLNVLAHVPDPNDILAGIAELLKDDSVAVIEVPYIRDLIEHCEFDTIYHEHFSYFSVTALNHLARRHGLFFDRVERLPIHGGSLRIRLTKTEKCCPSAMALFEEESRLGVNSHAFFRDFGERVSSLRERLRETINGLRAEGKTLAVYGAAAKGVILLNYLGMGCETFDFAVDRNSAKHRHYMPGLKIPVGPVDWLLERKPDAVVILAWNFADEIIEQQAEYLSRGGQFIVPIPEPKIVRNR